MIKITDVRVEPNYSLRVRFNDHCEGVFDLHPLIDRNTVLTAPLRDPAFFGRVYLELGALAWPNGLELSPGSVHAELSETRRLVRHKELA
jgi:hypothetical protein